jgi:ribosomal protein S18 acetylase RimI-like enzyme
MNTWRKLSYLISDLLKHLQDDGWREAGRWIAATLVSLPYDHIEYTVFTRSLTEPLPSIEPCIPVAQRLATEADLVRFQRLIPSWELHRFSYRLAHGRYCFLALDGENLAAYCWATTQVEFDVDNLEMQLQPGDAYLDDAFTVPAYRRQRIQISVHLYRLKYMRDLGCQRAILIVGEHNAASQQLVRKLGYQEADHLTFRRILWKRAYHYHQGKF